MGNGVSSETCSLEVQPSHVAINFAEKSCITIMSNLKHSNDCGFLKKIQNFKVHFSQNNFFSFSTLSDIKFSYDYPNMNQTITRSFSHNPSYPSVIDMSRSSPTIT